jgi:hypothetical protein
MTEQERERRIQEEAKRRRDRFDEEAARNWRNAEQSDDPPVFDPWTGHYL